MSESKPALDPVTELTKHAGATGRTLVEAMLVEPAKELGGVFTDKVAYWRWANRINTVDKAKKFLDKRGLTIESLPPDFAMPLLEKVGDVSDPDLTDLWARLLASAVESKANCRIAFVHVLSELSAVDAKALLLLAGEPRMMLSVASQDDNAEQLGVTREEIDLARSNLERLGLITDSYTAVSHFGAKLLLACTGELPANWQEDVAGGLALRQQVQQLDKETRNAKRKLESRLKRLGGPARLGP